MTGEGQRARQEKKRKKKICPNDIIIIIIQGQGEWTRARVSLSSGVASGVGSMKRFAETDAIAIHSASVESYA